IKNVGLQTAHLKAIHYFLNTLFFVQKDGPVGFNAFWQHAKASATLMQSLAQEAKHASLDPIIAYRCGLLHNIGLLLLGHLFPPEFCLLNKMLWQSKKSSIEMLEKKLLGMGLAQKMFGCGHAWLGSKLLEYWQLPEPLIITAREHHHINYQGNYQEYVYLQIIANSLLKHQNLGEGMVLTFPELPLHELGLSTSLLNEYLEKKSLFISEEEPIVEI
ncbi:MAG TPA: HDOD domain-containing protein, partial [Gammaproteobacteria bacterium]|nr:HDOD domain-containing protein [Gammaproteobacteria bacterium]